MPTLPKPPLPKIDSRRVSEPEGLRLSGMGYLPRRDVRDVSILLTPEGLLRAALENPLRALKNMRGIHPMLTVAEQNTLGLLCQPGDFRIEAKIPNGPGGADDETDTAATERLAELWDRLPQEAGGLMGLLESGIIEVLYTGMSMAECVPGPRMTGLAAILPIDPLTVRFGVDRETGALLPYQRQTRGMTLLPRERVYWRELGGGVGNPYGIALRAAAFNEILEDLRTTRDLRAAFHQIAWPRLVAAVDYNALREYALNVLRLPSGDEANAWVDNAVSEFFDRFSRMASDDTILSDTNAKIETVEGGKGFQNIDRVLAWFTGRMVNAIGTRPFMLGVTDTTTEAQAKEQFKLEALTLERIRAAAGEVLVRAANLHLRLLGINAVAEAVYEPIRTTDALIEAQTDSMKLATAGAEASMGIKSMDTVAQELTGSGLADPDRAEEWLDAQTKSGAASAASAGDSGRVGIRANSLDAIEATRQRRAARRGATQDAQTQEQNAEGDAS